MMNGSKTFCLTLLPVALLVGCGSTDPGATDGDGGGSSCTLAAGELLPWKIGNKWTYKIVEAGQQAPNKVTTIESAEVVGGTGPNAAKMAFKVVTKKGTDDQTISWQAPDGAKVVRYREQSFGAASTRLELEEHWDPYKLHIDGNEVHMVIGPAWIETYQETKLPTGGQATTATAMDAWKVISECETIQVLDKSYNALHVSKQGGDLKNYWYVPGVGKVKETGGQTEELIKFEPGP